MEWNAETLESKYAMQIVLAISENPGMCKKEVMSIGEGGNERTKYTRISNLIADGLIEVRQGGNQWNSALLYLTPEGQEVAKCVDKINKIYTKIKKQQNDL